MSSGAAFNCTKLVLIKWWPWELQQPLRTPARDHILLPLCELCWVMQVSFIFCLCVCDCVCDCVSVSLYKNTENYSSESDVTWCQCVLCWTLELSSCWWYLSVDFESYFSIDDNTLCKRYIIIIRTANAMYISSYPCWVTEH